MKNSSVLSSNRKFLTSYQKMKVYNPWFWKRIIKRMRANEKNWKVETWYTLFIQKKILEILQIVIINTYIHIYIWSCSIFIPDFSTHTQIVHSSNRGLYLHAVYIVTGNLHDICTVLVFCLKVSMGL